MELELKGLGLEERIIATSEFMKKVKKDCPAEFLVAFSNDGDCKTYSWFTVESAIAMGRFEVDEAYYGNDKLDIYFTDGVVIELFGAIVCPVCGQTVLLEETEERNGILVCQYCSENDYLIVQESL